jgi:hypothetical protein
MTPENTIEYRGFKIEIHRDDTGGDVSESLGGGNLLLFAWHRRYRFGERPPEWATEAMDEGRLHEAILAEYPEATILPVYMYEHSGIALSTGSFSCPWDSGQLGVIFTTEAMTSRWDEPTKAWVPAITPEDKRLGAERLLKAIVGEMDDRVQGNVWGFVVRTPEGDLLDDGSCWGYVGDDRDDGLVSAAREAIDYEIARRESGDRLVAEAYAL